VAHFQPSAVNRGWFLLAEQSTDEKKSTPGFAPASDTKTAAINAAVALEGAILKKKYSPRGTKGYFGQG
jgi:hypothetical protein